MTEGVGAIGGEGGGARIRVTAVAQSAGRAAGLEGSGSAGDAQGPIEALRGGGLAVGWLDGWMAVDG